MLCTFLILFIFRSIVARAIRRFFRLLRHNLRMLSAIFLENTLDNNGYRNTDRKIRHSGKPPKGEECGKNRPCPSPIKYQTEQSADPYGRTDYQTNERQKEHGLPVAALAPNPLEKVYSLLYHPFDKSFHSAIVPRVS